MTLYFVGLWFPRPPPQDAQDPGVPLHSGRHQVLVHEDGALCLHLLDRDLGARRRLGNSGLQPQHRFIGGSAIELQYSGDSSADPGKIREVLDTLKLGDVQVSGFRHRKDVLVRIQTQPGGDAGQQAAVEKVALRSPARYDVRRTETVGPQVSGELTTKGVMAVLVAMVAILIYVWFRFGGGSPSPPSPPPHTT